jgi:hypothetical protein
MLPFSDIYTERNYKRLKRKYRPNPPEYYLVGLIMKYNNDRFNNASSVETTNNFAQEYIHHLEKIHYYFHPYYTINDLISASNYEELFKIALTDYKLFNNFVDKIDVFSIGTIIAEMTPFIDKPQNQDFVVMMRGILHPDPRARMSPEDAILLCNKISSNKK